MKVLICCLTYGNRPNDILFDNIIKAGYPAEFVTINTEGISRALNDGIDLMKFYGADAVGFLANDITEPVNWLSKKVYALATYPNAGVVASSIHAPVTTVQAEDIIGNWLISDKAIEAVGYFNEDFHPYGPIDLDYCERVKCARLLTYYAIDCHAIHPHSHAAGTEYGYDKAAMVANSWPVHVENTYRYRAGIKPIYMERHWDSTEEMKEYPTL